MRVRLVPIGDSLGIPIPKAIRDECDIADEVELVVCDRQIVLSAPEKPPREGWHEAAARMAAAGDDALLIPDVFEDEFNPDEPW